MRVKLNIGIYLLQNGGDELTSNNLTLNDKNELMNLVTIWFYDDPNESDD